MLLVDVYLLRPGNIGKPGNLCGDWKLKLYGC